jgi:hypothetical protein
MRSCDAANLALERFEDDPERGIFWGPPSAPGGKPQRWSRPWFDWRAEELGEPELMVRRLGQHAAGPACGNVT